MDRLFIQIPLWPGQPPLEASSPQRISRTLLWITVLVSMALHLLLVAVLPEQGAPTAIEQDPRTLRLRLEPAAEKKVDAMLIGSDQVDRVRSDIARKPALPSSGAQIVKSALDASVISIGEALRQTLTQPSNLNDGIRCTPLQRRQRLINCDDVDSEIDQFAESDLSRSLDASLAIAVPTSERSMALRSRQLLYQSEELQREQLERAATSSGKNPEFLQSQVAQDLRQLRHQTDSQDRQRSSLDLLGVTVDTYRASDSHTRNPNVFNPGRL